MTRTAPLLLLLAISCDDPDIRPEQTRTDDNDVSIEGFDVSIEGFDVSIEGFDVSIEGFDGDVDGHRWSDDAGTLPLGATLSSRNMETSTRGPWQLRGTEPTNHLGSHHSSRSDGFGSATPRRGAAPPVLVSEMAASEMTLEARHIDQQAGSLKAGATDDNANFDAYLDYLGGQSGRFGSQALTLDVRGRQTIQALAPDGSPLPGARVSIVHPQTDALIWTARTQGDGRAPFYPALAVDGYSAAGSPPEGGWIVQVEKDGVYESQRWSGLDTELEVTLDAQATPPAVDVCFIIDTTGSMGDEIARIKQTLLSVTERLRADGDVDLRYGAVLYRDIGDSYVTKAHAFTDDIVGFDQALQGIQAAGGGDGPESLNQGLAVAVGELSWRPDTAKVAFLIADAPPHMDYQDDITYGRTALAAIHSGVRIHTVAASGLADRGSLVFRQVAQLSGGEFIFIEYGSVAAAAADHGVSAPVASNNLDDILYKRIHNELLGWGHAGDAISAR